MERRQSELNEIWNLIRDEDPRFPKEDYLGLSRVRFEIPYEVFLRTLNERLKPFPKPVVPIVTNNFGAAIKILRKMRVYEVSRVCAARRLGRNDTCLGVYVNDRTNDRDYLIAMPGVNLVPTKNKTDSWRKISELNIARGREVPLSFEEIGLLDDLRKEFVRANQDREQDKDSYL
ncbi:hypothetical protein COU61_00835 [Candidatus Pacearchaeota archaeon CG10_big_fil_rev_8_21_14_0_10_35_13]|nr:MAG: hypothetical protein COU61_00835 [Candidatus Pacearchaeota archaeon CG10_big_fil_rev_8_21_14_0_10_35_13]